MDSPCIRQTHRADIVILACGGWTPSLLPEVCDRLETTAGSVVQIQLPPKVRNRILRATSRATDIGSPGGTPGSVGQVLARAVSTSQRMISYGAHKLLSDLSSGRRASMTRRPHPGRISTAFRARRTGSSRLAIGESRFVTILEARHSLAAARFSMRRASVVLTLHSVY